MKLDSKKFLLLLLIINFVFILLLNISTPLIADDYSYSFGMNGRISGIFDIILYQYNHYMNWGGRTIAHFIAQCFLQYNKLFFNIFNSIIYIIFVYLIYLHGRDNEKDNYIYIIYINLLIWFFVPTFGQNIIWLVGSCNYLWTTTLILAFLLPYRLNLMKTDHKIILSIFMFLFGIISGWTNENSAAGMIAMVIVFIIAHYINNKKVYLWQITGLIGSVLGYMLLILAPGNYVRKSLFVSNLTFFEKVINRFISYTTSAYVYILPLVIIFSILIILLSLYNKKDAWIKNFWNENYTYVLYFITSILCIYVMIVSPTFPARAWFAVIIFLICGIVNLGFLLEDKITKFHLILKRMSYVFVFVFIFEYLFLLRDNIRISNEWKKRINYINEQKLIKSEIVVQKIETSNKRSALYGLDDVIQDPTSWPNTDLAKYFGIESIRTD